MLPPIWKKQLKKAKRAWIFPDRVRLAVEGGHGWDKRLEESLAAEQGPRSLLVEATG